MTAFPCPLCSFPSLKLLAELHWAPAWRTSQKRGVRCAWMTGCKHFVAFGAWRVVELPQSEERIAAWNTEAERLLATRTAHWTDAERARHRAGLGWDKPAIAA